MIWFGARVYQTGRSGVYCADHMIDSRLIWNITDLESGRNEFLVHVPGEAL